MKGLRIENQMCLWGFFSQIAENYLTTTNSNHSMVQSIEIKFIWSSLFCVLEQYSWDSKSEAFTHHRWIHESFRVMFFFLVDKWCLKISNRNIQFVCNKLRWLWIYKSSDFSKLCNKIKFNKWDWKAHETS